MNRGLLLFALVGIGFAGCSGNATPAANSGQQGPGTVAPAQPVAVPSNATPDQVVSVFLSGIRAGDKATTSHLLTTKARTETAKHNIAVDPPSTPGATYQVQASEILPDNPSGAHVTSVWTEKYADGTASTYQIVWVLRHEEPGWRIAGMALELVPEKGPAFLNFEDPEDMMRKYDEAVASQQPPAAETAQLPEKGNFVPATPATGPTGLPPTTLPPTTFPPATLPPEGAQPPAGSFQPSSQPPFSPPPASGFQPITQPPTAPPPTFAPPARFDR